MDRHGNLALLSPSRDPKFKWRVTYFKASMAMNHSEHLDRVSAVQSFLDSSYFPIGTDIPDPDQIQSSTEVVSSVEDDAILAP